MATTDQMDLFVANILDVAPKGDISTMEHPIFALSTKPDTQVWRYENGDNWIEVTPSAAGRPTIFDKDLLMYCISQVVEGINRGRKVERKVRVTGHDFLKNTQRGTGGKDYEAMMKSAARLRGVNIVSNIGDKNTRRGRVRGLIEEAEVVEHNGKMVNVDVVLSEWIFEAAKEMSVLTYSRRYYGLRSPNERRLYELCRKFCGTTAKWSIGFEKLFNRFGTRSNPRLFKQMLKKMVAADNIPDYDLVFDGDVLTVFFSPDELTKPKNTFEFVPDATDELFPEK